METFDLQDKLFDLFRFDEELCGLLGITDSTDIAQVDTKIRRSFSDPTLLTNEMLDFFDYSFVDVGKTNNILVNRGLLEFNIYTSYRYSASQIYRVIKRILKENFEDFQVIAEGQTSCAILGIFSYRVRFRPLVNS